MISVITVSVRPEGLALVAKALRRQVFKEFEWIVVSPEDPKYLECKWIKDPGKDEGDLWSINKAYNAGIKAASGELIVSWQDYTFAKHDALWKFWFYHTQEPKTIVSGVGNKYSDDTWAVKTWQDPRQTTEHGTFYPCYWNDIEGNFASVPREALIRVGGFDPKMDKYYGLDFFDVMGRINDLGGYDFKLDQTNESFSLEHGRLNGEKWDELNWMKNNRYNERIVELKKKGEYPILQKNNLL